MSGEKTTQHPEAYKRLTAIMAEVRDIENAGAVLGWDQRTYMPPAGAKARGQQLATLAGLAHSKATSPEVGELLSSLVDYEKSLPPDSDEASIIRVTRRQYNRRTRLPGELVKELYETNAMAYSTWAEARKQDKFEVFRPALERMLDISCRVADAFGYTKSPMDALIEESEPGVTTENCEALFKDLKATLVPLVKQISESCHKPDRSLLEQHYSKQTQIECGSEAAKTIGFDLKTRGRVDLTIHPFCTSFSEDDVRITTRVDEADFGKCFFALMHEAGHGIYEQGIPAALWRTRVGSGASAGMHESQSRLWENIVGRSREFWQFFLPQAKRYFPAQLAHATAEQMYRAVNTVRPSFVRVEADEVTYNLHIMLRFELEKDMLEGRLKVSDLRDAWNAKVEQYLGITPPSDLLGVLQDVHWTGIVGGGFQGYALGNVMGVQLFEAARSKNPAVREDMARGDFSALFGWMRQNVHAHAAKFEPLDLIERATGKPLDAKPYLNYITAKYKDIYAL